MNIAITGANSGVGTILLRHLAERADIQVVACVRSARAAAALPTSPRISARAIDYDDREGLASALTGTGCVVHLAGILFESPTSTLSDGQRRRHPGRRRRLQEGWSPARRAGQRARRGPHSRPIGT